MLEITIHSPREHQQFSTKERVIRLGGAVQGYDWSSLSDEPADLEIAVLTDEQCSAQVTNQGEAVLLPWSDGQIPTGGSATIRCPFQIRCGQTTIEFRTSRSLLDAGRSFQTIDRARGSDGAPVVPSKLLGEAPSSATLARWFETLGALQRSAAGSQRLFQETLRAVIQPGGMDGSLLLVRDQDDWRIAASDLPHPPLGIGFCRDLVDRVAKKQRTFYHDASEDFAAAAESQCDSVVAAPIFDPQGKVEGVLYGLRSMRGNNERRGIRPLEALWVQLLTESISAGLQRLQAEADAARTRVLFEQAFSGEVVRELINNPAILHGQELEVTVLFADLRRFSSISEKLGTHGTYQLLGDFLEHLTTCVMDECGVVIDYYGDGLAAMWNAPRPQSDHAARACRAALAMLDGLHAVSRRWRDQIGRSFNIGVGINTGRAQVGNAGTARRMKYGPRGTMVNIASRVEAATKHVGTSILITGGTAKCLPDSAIVPRVCRARLDGIQEPVDLHQLISMDGKQLSQRVTERIAKYDRVLELYEKGELDSAVHVLESIELNPSAKSVPNEMLVRQIMKSDPSSYEPIFDLTGK